MRIRIICTLLTLMLLTACNASASALPEGYTIEKIHEALLEELNYQRVMEPDDYQIGTKVVDGQEVEVEIRLSDEGQVCANTDLSYGLAWFELRGETVVCRGFSDYSIPGFNGWPKLGWYKRIDKSTIAIEPKRKPNYGTFELKTEILEALTEHMYWVIYDVALYDGYKSAEKYLGADIYFSDFYEYESGIPVITVLTSGEIVEEVYFFEVSKKNLSFNPSKPLILKNITEFGDTYQNRIEKLIEYAICHIQIDDEYLQKAQEHSVNMGTYSYPIKEKP